MENRGVSIFMDFPYLCYSQYTCDIVYWREYSFCSDWVVHLAIIVSTWCVPWHVAIAMSAQSGVETPPSCVEILLFLDLHLVIEHGTLKSSTNQHVPSGNLT